jgi:hypothetical protein
MNPVWHAAATIELVLGQYTYIHTHTYIYILKYIHNIQKYMHTYTYTIPIIQYTLSIYSSILFLTCITTSTIEYALLL